MFKGDYKDLTLTFSVRYASEDFFGFQWLYTNSKGDTLSIILNQGSYGFEMGLFEIYPSWCNPSKDDVVKGFLNFNDVNKWIKKLQVVGKD